MKINKKTAQLPIYYLPNSCHALPVSAMVLEKGHLPLPAQPDQALVCLPAPATAGTNAMSCSDGNDRVKKSCEIT